MKIVFWIVMLNGRSKMELFLTILGCIAILVISFWVFVRHEVNNFDKSNHSLYINIAKMVAMTVTWITVTMIMGSNFAHLLGRRNETVRWYFTFSTIVVVGIIYALLCLYILVKAIERSTMSNDDKIRNYFNRNYVWSRFRFFDLMSIMFMVPLLAVTIGNLVLPLKNGPGFILMLVADAMCFVIPGYIAVKNPEWIQKKLIQKYIRKK